VLRYPLRRRTAAIVARKPILFFSFVLLALYFRAAGTSNYSIFAVKANAYFLIFKI
jgi:hypothetical protein